MADVFLAKMIGKSDFAKLAVVKRLKVSDAEEPEVARMFAAEARLCARLNHPNIVQTFEVGEDTEGPYLVMEYVEGQPLARIRSRARRRATPLPRSIGLAVLKEALTALSYAHTLCDHDGEPLKVVHRDVSPENIIVTYAGTTKLVDFGVAKTANSNNKTRAGVLKGKIAYMAPEQARSDATIDARADVFSAGLVLWEILAGKRMWEGMTELDVVARLLDADTLPSVRTAEADVPEQLDRICSKALAKNRDERYASAQDMLEDIEQAQRDLDLRATAREIAQMVTGLFEDEREKMKKVVAAAATKAGGVENDDISLPRLANRASQTSDLIDADSDPNLWRAISSGNLPISPTPSTPLVTSLAETSTPATANTKAESVPPFAKKSGSGKAVGAIIAIALVLGGAAVFAYTRSATKTATAGPTPKDTTTAATTAPTTSPSASTTETTNNTPPPAPEVTIDIAAKPASARIYVDGKRAPGNPHRISVLRGDFMHEVRAEAEGYEPRSMTVAFDRDRAIDLPLYPKTYGAGPPRTGPAAPPRTVAAKAPPAPPETPATTAAPPPPAPTPTARGISEIDPSKSSTQPKQDKIDKDVFKR